MIFQQQLRIPGPTPLPERVVRAMDRPLVDHRGPEFKAVLEEIVPGLKKVFGTDGDMLLLTCSGTGGLESAVANLVSPGEPVIVALCGNFGERFVSINKAYGAEVITLEAEWGRPVEPADLGELLRAHPEVKLVFLTHNETSTGLTNNLQQLARVVRESGDRVLVVDGVSSVGSMPAEMDAWGIDVLVSGSQKGWMAPPGLAFMAVGPRAWAHHEQARAPRFYFDWGKLRDEIAKGATPYTPAVGIAYGVQEGLRMLFEEGLDNVYRRHRVIADACAAALEAAGFSLFAADGYRSATVTSAVPPAGLDVSALRTLLRQKYGVVIAGGQGKMTGKMIRVGHLGAVTVGDLVQVLWSIEQALEELDVKPADGRTLAAAGETLAREATPALA